jgi:hypothetical protein
MLQCFDCNNIALDYQYTYEEVAALILIETNAFFIVYRSFKACTLFRRIPADSSSYLGWFITLFVSDDAVIATKLHSRYDIPKMLIVEY